MADYSKAGLKGFVDEVLTRYSSFDLSSFAYPLGDEWALPPPTMQFAATVTQMLQPVRLVEFGAGFSSVVLGTVAGKYGGRVLSFDHSQEFAGRAQERIQRQSLTDTVTVVHRRPELRRYGWKLLHCYSIRWEEHRNFEDFELALVDGPPAYIGREAVLYELFPRVTVGGMIIVDDMNRDGEQRWLSSWKRVMGNALEIVLLPDIGRGVGVFRKFADSQLSLAFPMREVWKSWHHAARVVRRGIPR